VLLNIRYGNAMAKCNGSFIADRHHKAVAMQVSYGSHFLHHGTIRLIGNDGKDGKDGGTVGTDSAGTYARRRGGGATGQLRQGFLVLQRKLI